MLLFHYSEFVPLVFGSGESGNPAFPLLRTFPDWSGRNYALLPPSGPWLSTHGLVWEKWNCRRSQGKRPEANDGGCIQGTATYSHLV